MTIEISMDGSSRSSVTIAARLLVPTCIAVPLVWQRGYPVMAIVAVAPPFVAWSVWLVFRGRWKEIRIEETTISLVDDKTTVIVRREEIVKLELRDPAVIIKWRAHPKDRVVVLAKECFSPQTWGQLRAGLQSWAR